MERKGGEEKEDDGNNLLPHLKQAVAAYVHKRPCTDVLAVQLCT